ncbi:hypothetical protein HN446_04890 [bacterium]|jgi:hypothetical protein|nr:hypothetical protein [bacterium]
MKKGIILFLSIVFFVFSHIFFCECVANKEANKKTSRRVSGSGKRFDKTCPIGRRPSSDEDEDFGDESDGDDGDCPIE